MPPSEPVPGLGSGGRISYVDFLLHKAQVGQCRLTRHSIFFGDGSPIAEASGQTSPSLESTTQISGEVTTRSTKPVSSPTSTTTWSSASKMWPISSSRASSGRIPAHRRSQVSRDDRTTKDGSKSYLLRLLCSAASTASPFASLCELTRDCVTSSDHGPRGLVASPLHCNAPIPSGPTQGGGDSGRGRMYVAQPAKKNGGSAAVARSWGQRRGVAAPGWVRNTLVGAGTAPAAP